MKLGFAALLVNLAACWGSSRPAPAPIENRPAPQPARREPTLRAPEVAELGTFDMAGGFQPTLDIPLYDGSLFGWRIKLPCTQLVRFTEIVRLPSAGDWGASNEMTISRDLRTAVIRSTADCSVDGWIEKVWAVAPNDPPGEWIVRVEIDGFAPQEFRPSFVQTAAPMPPAPPPPSTP